MSQNWARDLVDTLLPTDDLKHQQAMKQAIDKTGAVVPRVADPFRTPITLDWGASPRRKRVPLSGRAVLLSAYADTPPTTGSCVCILTMVTRETAETEIGRVNILKGTNEQSIALAHDVPNGAWLKGSVLDAQGASDVDINVTISVATGGTT